MANINTRGLQLIGKGAFSKCYRLDETTVLIKSCDPVKECMAHGWFPECDLFPAVHLTDECNVYTMQYYPRVSSLKGALDPDQWEIYKTLRTVMDSIGYVKRPADRYSVIYKLFEQLPDELAEPLIHALDAVSNYGSDIGFEISPRNVTAHNGKLVLLDCFFILSALDQVRRKTR